MTIYILSGKVRSGKTTGLFDRFVENREAAGILAPDQQGERMVYDLETRRRFPLTARSGEGEVWKIGAFSFSVEAFREARDLLRRAFLRSPAWLVIDEIGPLELSGRGLEPVAGRIIRRYRHPTYPGNLLLVVREELLSAVLDRYKIREWSQPALPDLEG